MTVDKLGIDLLTHDPVVILKDMEGKRYLPILIGPFEATAIALALEGTKVPRPLSHDLMKGIINSLNARVLRIIIHDIKDNTFYAKVILEDDGKTVEVDARPSDSIALALRTDAPIFVSEKIILEETVIDKDAPEDTELKKFRQFVENMKPGDFAKDIGKLTGTMPEEPILPEFTMEDFEEEKEEGDDQES
ncbi:MAG: bifunctional nuclease family protein [Chloroflexi bacterium]|nr:bifunctional nuclease family protein [Chloroflexota bacterium]